MNFSQVDEIWNFHGVENEDCVRSYRILTLCSLVGGCQCTEGA